MKTSRQIQNDVYQLLRNSKLSEVISGQVYKAGMRPRDSKLEDAEVIFTAGRNGQVSSGVVTVNIFFADVSPYGNGVFVEDITRATELERASAEWVTSLCEMSSEYLFELTDTIYTMSEPDTRQHFVVIHLGYSIYEK